MIQTDATSTAWPWTKGSKKRGMNDMIQQVLGEAAKKRIFVRAEHIPGVQNKRADWLSRNPDPKNYHLKQEVVCQEVQAFPELDLFANRNNRQTKRFCSWRDDRMSEGNAWKKNWGPQLNWLNPPWEVIPRALDKIKKDKARAVCCLPLWATATWWPTLQEILVSPMLVLKGCPIYQDPEGRNLPPPRWATLFGIIQG